MTELSFARVSRAYSGASALTDVTFTLTPGSRTALVGPSGAGKSTLLGIAAGLDTGYTGDVSRTPTRPVVGYAFQEHRLLPWLSCEDNIVFALRAQRWPRAAALARARSMLELVELGSVAQDWPGTLSGGMRQRVALARALSVRPTLLLLDEPFTAIDEDQADRLGRHIRAEIGESGGTLLMVTHRYREACQVADRVLVVSHGRLLDDIELARAEPGDPEVDAAAELLVRRAAARARAAQAGVPA